MGRVVALTSISVKEPIRNLVLSNSLRTALVAALKTLSGDVASEGVTINCIATGRILTDRLRQLYDNDEEALMAAAQREIPMGRPGTPSEFAPLVTFLCGEPGELYHGANDCDRRWLHQVAVLTQTYLSSNKDWILECRFS